MVQSTRGNTPHLTEPNRTPPKQSRSALGFRALAGFQRRGIIQEHFVANESVPFGAENNT